MAGVISFHGEVLDACINGTMMSRIKGVSRLLTTKLEV